MLLLTRQDGFFTPGHIVKLMMFLSLHDDGQISQKLTRVKVLSAANAECGRLGAQNAPLFVVIARHSCVEQVRYPVFY